MVGLATYGGKSLASSRELAFEEFVFSFPFVDEECLVAWIVGGGDAFLICVSYMLGFDILMQVCEHGTELVNMALIVMLMASNPKSVRFMSSRG